MIGILKDNNVSTIGGTTPQVAGVTIVGRIGDWTVVNVEDSAISAIQEFNIQPVYEGFAEAINGPKQEGLYNQNVYKIENHGDKMMIENNPGQQLYGIPGIPDGTVLTPPDDMDTQSQKTFTAEDVLPYKIANNFIKKYDAKSVLRNQIRGNIVDIEDDIADTKVAIQTAMYYFAHEWNSRTPEQKAANPSRESMDILTDRLLSDDVKMRADLTHGIDSISEILEKEEKINNFITNNYTYNDSRGK